MRTSLIAASAILLSSPALAAGADEDQPGTSSGSQSTSGAMAADERQEMLREIRALRERINALEARQAAADAAASAAPPAPAAEAREESTRHKLLGDHNFEVYGFAQLDAIQDFDRVNPDWDATLRPSRIPTTKGQFGSDGQSIFSVRQSRLGAKANGTILGEPYEAKFEFDLYGVGVDAGQTTFRLRHAYGSWGPILAGQTNSLFMDGDIFPNVIDYWGPTGMVFLRNPQVRLTLINGGGWKAAIALENPGNDIDAGNIRLVDESIASSIRNDEELPDLTAQVRYAGDWGHVQLAGILRQVGFDTVGTVDNEPEGSELGWGVNLTGSAKLGFVTPRLGVVYGQGIASYMNDGGMDLAPKAALMFAPPAPGQPIFPPPPPSVTLLLEPKAIELLGISAYADLQWSKELTSSIGYSFTEVDNTNFQDPTAFHKGEYASGNLLWAPSDRILTGLELLWGQRTDNDGNKGSDLRLQSSFKVSFSSKDIFD